MQVNCPLSRDTDRFNARSKSCTSHPLISGCTGKSIGKRVFLSKCTGSNSLYDTELSNNRVKLLDLESNFYKSLRQDGIGPIQHSNDAHLVVWSPANVALNPNSSSVNFGPPGFPMYQAYQNLSPQGVPFHVQPSLYGHTITMAQAPHHVQVTTQTMPQHPQVTLSLSTPAPLPVQRISTNMPVSMAQAPITQVYPNQQAQLFQQVNQGILRQASVNCSSQVPPLYSNVQNMQVSSPASCHAMVVNTVSSLPDSAESRIQKVPHHLASNFLCDSSSEKQNPGFAKQTENSQSNFAQSGTTLTTILPSNTSNANEYPLTWTTSAARPVKIPNSCASAIVAVPSCVSQLSSPDVNHTCMADSFQPSSTIQDFLSGFEKVAAESIGAQQNALKETKNQYQMIADGFAYSVDSLPSTVNTYVEPHSPSFTSRSFDDFHKYLGNGLSPSVNDFELNSADTYAFFALQSAHAVSQHSAYARVDHETRLPRLCLPSVVPNQATLSQNYTDAVNRVAQPRPGVINAANLRAHAQSVDSQGVDPSFVGNKEAHAYATQYSNVISGSEQSNSESGIEEGVSLRGSLYECNTMSDNTSNDSDSNSDDRRCRKKIKIAGKTQVGLIDKATISSA